MHAATLTDRTDECQNVAWCSRRGKSHRVDRCVAGATISDQPHQMVSHRSGRHGSSTQSPRLCASAVEILFSDQSSVRVQCARRALRTSSAATAWGT